MIYCDLYGDCDLLRGPGMDVTDPSGRHRRRRVHGQKCGVGGSSKGNLVLRHQGWGTSTSHHFHPRGKPI